MSMRRSAVYAAITEHNMMVADLEEAQATIERVRSACNRIIENAQRFDLDDEHGLVYGQWMTAKSILRALDGDA